MIGQVIKNPFPAFFDNNGQLLEDGYIFIGESGLNPETSPVDVYWDDDFLYPAAQPIRTINGFPSRSGTPSAIVTKSTDYSILVKNKTEELIYSALSLTETTDIFKLVKGADVASASILTVGDDGNYFDITGTTTITSIATKGLNSLIFLQFDASLTLTHHATDLVLPNDNNIVTQAGDEAIFYEYSSGDWRLVSYLSNKNTSLGMMRWLKGADIASASDLTVGDDGNYFDITGTTTITSIAAKGIGTGIKLHFDGILTLTHNADLLLPTEANITTAVGDEAEFVEFATGDWRCTNYERADGTPIIGYASDAEVLAGTSTTKAPSVASMGAHEGVSKVWVNFNGTGTPSIRDEHNVSSITDHGVGEYTVNFSVTLDAANYAYVGMSGENNVNVVGDQSSAVPTTTSLRILVQTASAGTAFDAERVSIVILGG